MKRESLSLKASSACNVAILAAAISVCIPGRASSNELDDVLQTYGPLEWIAGLNGQSSVNGNEWNDADGLPATEAELSEPHSAAGDLMGNVYVADKNAHAIRRIDPDGIIHTVAGTNTAGFDGDGPARQKQLNGPQNAYPMPDGSFYILDTGNQMIRRVDPKGQMTTVMVETAGLSRGLWVKRDASVIYYCTTTALKRWTPARGTSPGMTMASGFSECGNIDVAANGDVYLTDRGATNAAPGGSRVYRIIPNATPSTFMPVPVAGVGGGTNSGPGSNGELAMDVGLLGARGIAFHPRGGYFVATHKGGDIWYVDTAGAASVVVNGDDGNSHDSSPAYLPTGSNTISEARFVSVALNGDLLMATNDAGYIRRARYLGPNPASANVSGVRLTGSNSLRIEWNTPPNAWYSLESSRDPAASLWSPLAVGPAPAAGMLSSWTGDPLTGVNPRLFYRIRTFRAWPN